MVFMSIRLLSFQQKLTTIQPIVAGIAMTMFSGHMLAAVNTILMMMSDELMYLIQFVSMPTSPIDLLFKWRGEPYMSSQGYASLSLCLLLS